MLGNVFPQVTLKRALAGCNQTVIICQLTLEKYLARMHEGYHSSRSIM